jgi:hypothetical protein
MSRKTIQTFLRNKFTPEDLEIRRAKMQTKLDRTIARQGWRRLHMKGDTRKLQQQIQDARKLYNLMYGEI